MAQLARRLSREGLTLTVECHAPVSMATMAVLLPRLPLRQYDLIVLQAGHTELQYNASFRDLFAYETPPADRPPYHTPRSNLPQPKRRGFRWYQRLSDAIGLTMIRLFSGIAGLPRLQQTRHNLRTVLDTLQPYGHNVVLLTPFPHQEPVSGWLRKQGRSLFLEEGYRAFMPVFDTHALLNMGDVCFLTDEPAQLNAVGHELVGSALYDFYRVGTSVVDDSSSSQYY